MTRTRRRLLHIGSAIVALAALDLESSSVAAEAQPRSHDGVRLEAVFLRVALGVAWFHSTVVMDPEANQYFADPIYIRGTITGFGIAGQLEAGYSLLPGFTVGLGAYVQQVGSLKSQDATLNDGTTREVIYRYDYRLNAGALTIVGPFVDWYLKPTWGLHLEACPGLGFLSMGRGDDIHPPVPGSPKGPALNGIGGAGVGLMLGAGYDLWVSDQWSVGLLGRLMTSFGKVHSDDGIGYQITMYAPALLVSGTLN